MQINTLPLLFVIFISQAIIIFGQATIFIQIVQAKSLPALMTSIGPDKIEPEGKVGVLWKASAPDNPRIFRRRDNDRIFEGPVMINSKGILEEELATGNSCQDFKALQSSGNVKDCHFFAGFWTGSCDDDAGIESGWVVLFFCHCLRLDPL